MNEKKVKSFRDQLKECCENGTKFIENCPACGHPDNMCKKFGGRCHSGKCREERINNAKNA